MCTKQEHGFKTLFFLRENRKQGEKFKFFYTDSDSASVPTSMEIVIRLYHLYCYGYAKAQFKFLNEIKEVPRGGDLDAITPHKKYCSLPPLEVHTFFSLKTTRSACIKYIL